jgi:hypothetical protein
MIELLGSNTFGAPNLNRGLISVKSWDINRFDLHPTPEESDFDIQTFEHCQKLVDQLLTLTPCRDKSFCKEDLMEESVDRASLCVMNLSCISRRIQQRAS